MLFFTYWGISKKDASTIEKQVLFDILNGYMKGKIIRRS